MGLITRMLEPSRQIIQDLNYAALMQRVRRCKKMKLGVELFLKTANSIAILVLGILYIVHSETWLGVALILSSLPAAKFVYLSLHDAVHPLRHLLVTLLMVGITAGFCIVAYVMQMKAQEEESKGAKKKLDVVSALIPLMFYCIEDIAKLLVFMIG